MNEAIESRYSALRATLGMMESIRTIAQEETLSVRDVMLVLGMDVEG